MAKKKTDVIPEPEGFFPAPETPEVTQSSPERKPVRKAAVASDVGLNLRVGPCLDVVRILADGEELALVDIPEDASIEGWCPVIAADGERGWVMSRYLRMLEG